MIFKNHAFLKVKKRPFRITKLNTFHYGAFAWITNFQLVKNSTPKEKAVGWYRYEYIIEKGSWSLIVKEIELSYDDKDTKLIFDGHKLPCLMDDGFCKPTILTPNTIVWFPQELCLIYLIHSFIGRMSKLKSCFWLPTEYFLNNINTNVPPGTLCHDSETQTRLSCSEISCENNFTINLHLHRLLKTLFLFISNKEGFNKHTDERNPLQLPEDDHYIRLSKQFISGKLFHTPNKLLLPSFKSSKNFANFD